MMIGEVRVVKVDVQEQRAAIAACREKRLDVLTDDCKRYRKASGRRVGRVAPLGLDAGIVGDIRAIESDAECWPAE